MTRARWQKPVSLLLIALIVSAVMLGLGVSPLLSVGVAVAVAALIACESRPFGLRARREERRRARLSTQEDRRCKGCNGDLWGLDVQPGKGSQYRVKCPECGVVTDFEPERITRPRRSRKRQWEHADTRSFKIR